MSLPGYLIGVPQGFILDSLVFLIHVNHLCKYSEELNPVMFADNSNFFLSGINADALFSNAKRESNEISPWFEANKLSLNLTETEYSLFHPGSKEKRFPRELLLF